MFTSIIMKSSTRGRGGEARRFVGGQGSGEDELCEWRLSWHLGKMVTQYGGNITLPSDAFQYHSWNLPVPSNVFHYFLLSLPVPTNIFRCFPVPYSAFHGTFWYFLLLKPRLLFQKSKAFFPNSFLYHKAVCRSPCNE